ncbi:calponin-like protein [Ophiostoma piceae UAMH 11346]|uniref:Calponin-like protein n=1 Tax=Ophiostoma piceae (strain UAMH 11346) TaxID=1262450 RepID=S3CVR7_OPHP1|nr:calponin-like protein [Ophiostoma piceae UAMH 11346]
MASVTSLDGDLRRMRLDKYTPGAAREARSWIEDVLGEPIAPGDLLDALKDGVALCRLANMAIPPPGIRFKKSAMPFVQMENISHFLRACQAPPLNLQQHDTFLTVDLYEAKDPAQVLQCLGAFSRAANKAHPSAFPSVIGARPANSATAPTSPPGRGTTPGSGRPMPSIYSSRTPLAPARTGEGVSSRWSPTKDERSPSPTKSPTSASTSSWSKRELEGATSPAWNIAQYGYMGGASQGNLGISFGGRRQITSAGPSVPNAAQKERLRKEKEAEELRAKQLMVEEAARRRAELEAEEERARYEEQLRWEEETERQRVAEKQKAEEERRKWEEEERNWKLTEEARKREEEEAEARLVDDRQHRLRSTNSSKSSNSAAAAADPKLNGQFLSQYQAENNGSDDPSSAYTSRVRELEKELEQARQREQAYELERQGRPRDSPAGSPAIGSSLGVDDTRTRSRSRGARSRSRPRALPNLASPPVRQESWSRNDKEVLLTPRSRSRHRFADAEAKPTDHIGGPSQEEEVGDLAQFQSSQPMSPRPLPDPRNHFQQPQQPQKAQPPQLPQRLHKQRTGERQQQAQSPPQSSGPPSMFQKMRAQRTGEKMAPSAENAPISSSPLRAQRTGDGPSHPAKSQGRPLPNPTSYASPPQPPKKLPVPQKQPQQELPPQPTYSRELLGGGVAEHDAEDRRRRQQAYSQQQQQQQQQPLAKQRQRGPFGGGSAPQSPASTSSSTPGGGASRPGKSLLEREMEMERQRQREWEEAQRETAAAPRQAEDVEGVNGRWDVNQWNGFTGGDSQNRGSQGIGSGRRQIVGPRPLPGQR